MGSPKETCEASSVETRWTSRIGWWGRLALVALLSGVVGAAIGWLTIPGARDLLLPKQKDMPATIGGAFALTDHRGRAVTQEDFRGRYMMVTFGFTNSPDLTPSLLQLMAEALDRLGTPAEQIVPVFVTLDPERDGPDVIARWVGRFHPRLVGLTGTSPNVAAMAASWRMPFHKVPDPAAPHGYVIEHAALIYLMGPEGAYIAHFGPSHSAPDLTLRLQRELSGR